MAHARRYYSDSLKILPKEAEIEKTHAYEAIKYFREMFHLEDEWKKLSPEVRDRKSVV